MTSRHKRRLQCQICEEQVSKYTCAQCRIVYCSVGCYKNHKGCVCLFTASSVLDSHGNSQETVCNSQSSSSITEKPVDETHEITSEEDPLLISSTPLRPLTSLNWPYVPDESAFPDPLKKNDPKALQLSQYEAIATSPVIRKILSTHKRLPELLTSINKLRGAERNEALQRALGITAPEIDDQLPLPKLSDDVLALREFSEAIEAAVRGEDQSALGLNWGE